MSWRTYQFQKSCVGKDATTAVVLADMRVVHSIVLLELACAGELGRAIGRMARRGKAADQVAGAGRGCRRIVWRRGCACAECLGCW